MLNVKFSRLEDLLDFLPTKERQLIEQLRELVFENVPGVTERLSYSVPYYKRNKDICFLWPASVLWGKNKSHKGVRFGFTRGHLLTDEAAYLERGTRKQVFWKDFAKLTKPDIETLRQYLLEAVLIDESGTTM